MVLTREGAKPAGEPTDDSPQSSPRRSLRTPKPNRWYIDTEPKFVTSPSRKRSKKPKFASSGMPNFASPGKSNSVSPEKPHSASPRKLKSASSREANSASSRKPIPAAFAKMASSFPEKPLPSTSPSSSASSLRDLAELMKRTPTPTPSRNRQDQPEAFRFMSPPLGPWDFPQPTAPASRASSLDLRLVSRASSTDLREGRTREQDHDHWISQGRSPVFPHLDYSLRRSLTPRGPEYYAEYWAAASAQHPPLE